MGFVCFTPFPLLVFKKGFWGKGPPGKGGLGFPFPFRRPLFFGFEGLLHPLLRTLNFSLTLAFLGWVQIFRPSALPFLSVGKQTKIPSNSEFRPSLLVSIPWFSLPRRKLFCPLFPRNIVLVGGRDPAPALINLSWPSPRTFKDSFCLFRGPLILRNSVPLVSPN